MSTTTTTTPALCSCGHPPTADASKFTTGYARTADGRTLCYPCAETAELADFLATRPGAVYPCYLSSDSRTVSTWTGAPLARVTSFHRTRAGFGGRRIYWRARDVLGREWYGSAGFAGEYTRARPAEPRSDVERERFDRAGADELYATAARVVLKWRATQTITTGVGPTEPRSNHDRTGDHHAETRLHN